MANGQIDMDFYKKLICDMVQDIDDGRTVRQLYAYIRGGLQKEGRVPTKFDKPQQKN